MGRFFIYQAAIIFLLMIARPLRGLGNGDIRLVAVSDTVPNAPKPPEKQQEKAKKVPDIIKEVPKTRRQLKPAPIPTPIPVKPIKVIKPKVLKRVTGMIR